MKQRIVAGLVLLLIGISFQTAKGQESGNLKKTTGQEVFFKNGRTRLAGLVLLPEASIQSTKGLVLIHGSHEGDRSDPWMYALAQLLAAQGVTVLLPDKRGCGKSEGDWHTADCKDLAEDAAAGITHLSKQFPQLTHVGLLGIGQGGQIAPLAATLSHACKFVINLSGAAVPLEEQMMYEVVNTCRQYRMSTEQIQQVVALHSRMKAYTRHGDWEGYITKLNELKKGSLSKFLDPFPDTKDAWLWQWTKINLDYTPLPYWGKVNVPILIVYREEDEAETVPVWQSVYELESAFHQSNFHNYRIKVYPFSGQSLYRKSKPSPNDAFVKLLIEWIGER